ncbi:MAG: 2-amino-4-hydroxy-6-hydroxymethyldihydropteridine diphosphokinase [Bacteroidetes bacterium]|nr:2-amino-4-hydroxy-6-hydroxymethyldihydropteridine diphosphokinase [Bacteroidota bacterium]
MNLVFLGLGGNTGNRLENLKRAVNALQKSCGRVLKQSSVYETEAWGFVSHKNYLNQVVSLETALSPQQLLKEILNIESELGRTRSENRYSDRSLDIDILLFNGEIISAENLEIPHPRLHERRFVLVPLNDVAPTVMHPVLKKTLSELLKNCQDTLLVEKYSQENFG